MMYICEASTTVNINLMNTFQSCGIKRSIFFKFSQISPIISSCSYLICKNLITVLFKVNPEGANNPVNIVYFNSRNYKQESSFSGSAWFTAMKRIKMFTAFSYSPYVNIHHRDTKLSACKGL